MDDRQAVLVGTVQQVVRAIGLVLGLVLVGFGLWALAGAVYAAWGLYEDPGSIALFVRYFTESTDIASHLPQGGEGLAHYASWLLVILLLLLVGKLGFWSVDAGARLLAMRGR
jgi:hypothetical protein